MHLPSREAQELLILLRLVKHRTCSTRRVILVVLGRRLDTPYLHRVDAEDRRPRQARTAAGTAGEVGLCNYCVTWSLHVSFYVQLVLAWQRCEHRLSQTRWGSFASAQHLLNVAAALEWPWSSVPSSKSPKCPTYTVRACCSHADRSSMLDLITVFSPWMRCA